MASLQFTIIRYNTYKCLLYKYNIYVTYSSSPPQPPFYCLFVQEGSGQFWWTDGGNAGDKYVGEFSRDERNGHGVYYFKNGDIFAGRWLAGRQAGPGRILYRNGNHMEGRWENGQRTGPFLFTFPNGEQYEGLFEGGRRVGDWARVARPDSPAPRRR